MLRVLMESQATRQRREGGAILSVALHLAVIGAVTATTVRASAAPPAKVEAYTLRLARPVAPTPVLRETSVEARMSTTLMIQPPSLPRISIPIITPTSLPPIDAAAGFSPDSITAPIARGSAGTGAPRGLSFGDEGVANSGAWRGNELLMHVLSPARPRYPDVLRQAGIDGRVLVRFVVDTSGRVDLSSVQVVSSTHDLFSRAVRDALGNFRFRPAEVGGRRVAALAEMPFEFQISR